jgi:hypothetical protein
MVVIEGGRVLWVIDGRRRLDRLDGRDVRPKTTGATRRMGESCGRGQFAGRRLVQRRILLTTTESRQRGEGVGSLVGGRLCNEMVLLLVHGA